MTRACVSFAAAAALAAGCGGDDPSTEIKCGTGTSGALAEGAPVTVTSDSGSDLRGAAIATGPGTTIPASEVSIACASDIVPAG